MAEKAGRVNFYHHFSFRLLVQKTRCPVQIHKAVPSVHCLSYNMNLGSVKYLFTAASVLLPVEHDLSRQTVASVASSMAQKGQGKPFWEGSAWPTGMGPYHCCDLWCSTAPTSPLEGGDISHPSPILRFWVTLVRLPGEEHAEGGVLAQSCAVWLPQLAPWLVGMVGARMALE